MIESADRMTLLSVRSGSRALWDQHRGCQSAAARAGHSRMPLYLAGFGSLAMMASVLANGTIERSEVRGYDDISSINDGSSPWYPAGSEIGPRGTAEWGLSEAVIWCRAFRGPRAVCFLLW